MERTRILFLAANPDSTTALHAGREVRRIRERLAGTRFGGSIEIVERWAVRPGDLQPALREVRPHVVHFSGHGNTECELMLEDEGGSPRPVGQRVLGELFRLRGEGVRLVVLSACHSLPQAEAIAEHVDCAIGMRRAVGSEAAIELSAALYEAIASGDPVQGAFESARLHLEVIGSPEHRTPQLVVRKSGVDPARVFLTGPYARAAAAASLPAAAPPPAAPSAAVPPTAAPPAAVPPLEFASIAVDRAEARWRSVPERLAGSPFDRDCSHHLALEAGAEEDVDLPFDVTVLNLASRPVTLTHVGIELVELCPRFDRRMGDDYLSSTRIVVPTARKVKRKDAYVIEGQEIFKRLCARVRAALRASGARGTGIVPIGETVWSQLDDPVHLDSNAPYRFGVIVRDVRQCLPRHMVLRLTARTQLGDQHSSALETWMPP